MPTWCKPTPRLLSVHAVAAHAVRAARVARHARRGRTGERVPPAHLPRLRHARRRPRGLETQAVRDRAEVVLRHRLRDHGARGHQRRRSHRARLQTLQSRARRRPVQGGRQAVPHRPHGRSQRAHAARRDRGRRDGHARCRRQDRTRQRRGRRAELLARQCRRRRTNRAAPHDTARRVPRSRLAQGEGAQTLLRHRIRRVSEDRSRGDRAAARAERASRSSTRCRCGRRRSRNCRS